MVYLTFFNTYSVDKYDELKKEVDCYEVSKWYDLLHISLDPLPLIHKISLHEASSITLNYIGKDIKMLPYIYLLIVEPGKYIPNTEPVEGLYSHILTSSYDISDKLKNMDGVKGMLDINVKTPKDVILQKSNDNLFKTDNASLTFQPNEDIVKEYFEKSYEFAKIIDEYKPSLIIAPAPHGAPVAKSILWNSNYEAYKIFFPIGENYMNSSYSDASDEIIKISREVSDEDIRRICYINGVRTGEEYLELRDTLFYKYKEKILMEETKLICMGLVDNYGDDITMRYKYDEEIIDAESFILTTKSLFTSLYEVAEYNYQKKSSNIDTDNISYLPHFFPFKDKKGYTYNREDLLDSYFITNQQKIKVEKGCKEYSFVK